MMRPIVWVSFLALPWVANSQDLFQALTDAGAGRYANFIQSNENLKATYTSGRVRTVFAPSDLYFVGKRADSTTADEQKALLQASDQEGDIRSYRTLPGKKVTTLDVSANLNGLAQTVVTDARSNAAGSKRSDLGTRQGTSLVQIASGLGNKVNVIKGDIPYTGGLIHIVDGSFSIPQPLSDTAQLTGQTIFANLMSSANLTESLNNAPLTTFFIPSNAALTAAGLTTPGPDTAAMLAEHVIPNFAAYLPDLQNGLALPNQNGRALTISVKNGEYFVGDAKIIQANQILANGVAYVIDGVLGTPTASKTSGTATSSSAPTGTSGAVTSSAPTGAPGTATSVSAPAGTTGTVGGGGGAPTKTLETVTTGGAPTATPSTVTVSSAPTTNSIKDVRSMLVISIAMAAFYLMI